MLERPSHAYESLERHMFWTPIPPPPIAPPPALSPRAGRFRSGSWFNTCGYRSALVRARVAQGLLAIMAILSAIASALTAQGLFMMDTILNGTYVGRTERETWLEQWEGSLGLYILLMLIVAIAFLGWHSRSVDNLPPLAGGTPSRGPRQAIGWWFVPIANLLLPFLVMRETWERYATPTRNGRGWLVAAWWFLFVVATTLIFGLGRLPVPDPMDRGFADFVRLAFGLYAVGFAASAAGAVAAIALIELIERRASDRVAALGLANAGMWTPSPNGWVPPTPGAAAYVPAAYISPPPPPLVVNAPAWPATWAWIACPRCGTNNQSGSWTCRLCSAPLPR